VSGPRRAALVVAALAVLAGALAGARVAAPAPGAWEPDRRLTVDPGHSLTTYNFARSVAAEPDGRVHAVWYDDRGGSFQIYTKRSLDHGATWESDHLLSPGFEEAEHPAIASSGQTILVVWHGRLPGATGVDVYLRRSHDGGRSWEPVTALTASHGAANCAVALSGQTAQIVWGDGRSGFTEVLTRGSSDGGASWGGERQLSAGRRAASWVPTVEVAGEAVHVAWVDTQDGNEEEYYRLSTDAGRTWEPAIRLTRNVACSWAPSLAVAGSRVHLVWFDQRDSPVQPREAEAELDGILRHLGLPVLPEPSGFSPTEVLQARVAAKLQQVIAAAPAWVAGGGDPAALEAALHAFEQHFEQSIHEWEIYTRQSDDGGKTWGPIVRLTHAPGLSHRPSIVADMADGDRVTVLWFDDRDGNQEIYAKESADGGETWSTDQRLTRAPGDSRHVSAATAGGELYAVWYDERDGNPEIYFKHRPR
jgi:hypothetical protein